jgi:hypothetical protein
MEKRRMEAKVMREGKKWPKIIQTSFPSFLPKFFLPKFNTVENVGLHQGDSVPNASRC